MLTRKQKGFLYLVWFFIGGFQTATGQIIYHHAKIYTVDSSFSIYSAMAVDRNKIVALGTKEELMKKYPAFELTDMKGKYIYPGLIDAHCHFMGLGLSMQIVELKGTKSMEEVIERCQAYLKKNPGNILFGRGWDQNDWTNKEFPDNEILNKIFPNQIVILKRVDGHAALCNDRVLSLAKITANTKPDGGEVISKNGRPTGILIDNAVDLVMKFVPALSEDYIYKSMKLAQDVCLNYGLTTVVDAGLELDTLQKIQHIYQKNLMEIRFSGMYSASEKCLNYIGLEKSLKFEDYMNYFAVKGIKVYADGALGSRGACLKQPYSDRDQHYGFLLTPLNEMDRIASIALKYQLQMNVHCIGDSAAGSVLKIMSNYLGGVNDKRWRIEHAQVIAPQDLFYFKNYSIIPSVQPTHATSDMTWASKRLGEQRVHTAYTYKDLMYTNGWIALGTDFPVEEVSPLKTFYAAVIRKDEQGNPKNGFQMENALSRKEALYGMTIWAAKSIFEENNRGSLEPGKWADFIVLDKDIMTIDSSEIVSTRVLETYIAGKRVYMFRK